MTLDPTWISQVTLDGEPTLTLTCPGCGTYGYLDDDQAHGRVSVLCECGWHETHDFWSLLRGGGA